MKYFYFQMLKDKKIIHKTDGKKKPNKHSFPLQEEATEQTHVVFPISPECNPSCYFHICKSTETDYFPRESCDWTPPLPPRPRPFSGDGGQEAAGGRCSLLSETSCAVDEHHFPNIEWTINAKKRGLFTFTPFAPWDEWSRTTRISVPQSSDRTPSRTWVVSNNPKSL